MSLPGHKRKVSSPTTPPRKLYNSNTTHYETPVKKRMKQSTLSSRPPSLQYYSSQTDSSSNQPIPNEPVEMSECSDVDMDGGKTPNREDNKSLNHKKKNFSILSNRMGLSPELTTKVWAFLEEVYSSQKKTFNSNLNAFQDLTYIICAIWCVERLNEKIDGSDFKATISLFSLQTVGKLTSQQLLSEINSFGNNVAKNILQPQQLKQLDQNLVAINEKLELHHKRYKQFKETFQGLFDYDPIAPNKAGFGDIERYPDEVFRFTYTLYLVLCGKALENGIQIHSEVAMVSCFHFVGSQVHNSFRRDLNDVYLRLFQSTGVVKPQNWEGDWFRERTFLLLSLLKKYSSIEENLIHSQYIHIQETILDFFHKNLLQYEKIQERPEEEYPLFIGAFACLMKQSFLLQNCEILNQMYEKQLESTFINELDSRIHLPKKQRTVVETPRKPVSSSPRTPRCGKSPATRNLLPEFNQTSLYSKSMSSTPLTAKMLLSKVKYVTRNNDCHPLQLLSLEKYSEPSTIVLKTYKLYGDNVENQWREIVIKLKETICQKDSCHMDVWNMGVKLYFRELENVLIKESSKSDYYQLITDEKYHRSLMALCLELVRFSFQVQTTSFDEILYMLKVNAFNFAVIIDIVIKNDPELHWSLIKRLKEIEERILEKEVWREEDPLYLLMFEELDHIKDPEQMSRKLAIEKITKDDQNGSEITVILPSSLGCTGVNCNCYVGLQSFFYKLNQLLYTRLQRFSNLLTISESIQEKIWDLLVSVVMNEHSTKLFYKRHVDAIVICAIYATSRFYDNPITFKNIIEAYKKHPQWIETAYKKVYMGPDNPLGGLVDFYNKIFIRQMRSNIGQKHKRKVAEKPRIPPLPTAPLLPSRSQSMFKLFMSPRKRPTRTRSLPSTPGIPATPSFMTPRICKLMSFGETPEFGEYHRICSEKDVISKRKLHF